VATLDLSLHLAHPRCPQALNDGEDLRFSFEAARAGGETPYWQQGHTDLESPEALAMRAALRQDARVQRELGRFWSVHSKLADGMISKDEYLKVRVKIALALIPDMTPEEARAAGEEDWVADAKGADRMSAEQLHDYLFELADLWCSAIDGHEYAAFVRKLFRRVAVKVVHGSDGKVSVSAPAQPSRERKEEFETFRDARRRKLGLPPLGAAPMPSGASISGASSPAGGDEEEEAEADGIGETVTFGWAPESEIYPLILYEEAPIDWAEYGDMSVGAKGAPPVPPLPVRTATMVPRFPMVQRELQSSSYSAKLLLPKQLLAEETDTGGSAAAPSAARAHTARPQVSFAELEAPEPPAGSKLPVRPASAQVSSRSGAQLAADGSADDGEAGAAEAPAALRAPAVALPVPPSIQMGMPYENALALAQLSASSRALVTRHAVVRGLPKDLKADLMIPPGKGGYLKGAIALSHGGATPNKKAPPPPSPLALPSCSSSGRSMMPPPAEPDMHPGLLAVATACAATLASAKGAGRDAPDTALSATAAKDAVSAVEPPREGVMPLPLPRLAPEPCGELALLLGSARTNPKPRHVLLAGPPLLSEPLATALASALGAVLVSPTAAVMAASKGDDPLANVLRNALSSGLTIGRAEQKEALLQLLASPEAQARGTVLFGLTSDAVTAANGTPPTATLAVVMAADELAAWKEEAEAAAAADEPCAQPTAAGRLRQGRPACRRRPAPRRAARARAARRGARGARLAAARASSARGSAPGRGGRAAARGAARSAQDSGRRVVRGRMPALRRTGHRARGCAAAAAPRPVGMGDELPSEPRVGGARHGARPWSALGGQHQLRGGLRRPIVFVCGSGAAERLPGQPVDLPRGAATAALDDAARCARPASLWRLRHRGVPRRLAPCRADFIGLAARAAARAR
jgi:hypothetical protein